MTNRLSRKYPLELDCIDHTSEALHIALQTDESRNLCSGNGIKYQDDLMCICQACWSVSAFCRLPDSAAAQDAKQLLSSRMTICSTCACTLPVLSYVHIS